LTAVIQFSYLQVLDILTTLAFLGHGVKEVNPLVRCAVAVAPSPLSALLALKIVAIFFAFCCWYTGRSRLLARANLFFAALVLWNLVAIVLKSQAA
jgi:hypothetical protein